MQNNTSNDCNEIPEFHQVKQRSYWGEKKKKSDCVIENGVH